MGKVITVMNMKGGVGKTTVTANLAWRLSMIQKVKGVGRKVLVVDYDPQFNLSQAYLPAKAYFELEASGQTVLSVLQDDVTKLNPFALNIPATAKPPKVDSLAVRIRGSEAVGSCLDLVPSTLSLMYVALGQSNGQVATIEGRFRAFIDEARSKYDAVFIDCHPAGSLMTRTALSNSDHVLIPVAPERYSVRGIGLMMDFVKKAKDPGGTVVPHILFNKLPRTGSSPDELSIRANPRFAPYCFISSLRKYSAFAELIDGRGFVATSSKAYSTEAFHNLNSVCSEVISRLGV